MDFYIKISDTEKVFVGSVEAQPVDEVYFSVTGSCEVGDYAKLVANKDISIIPHRYRNMATTLGLNHKQTVLSMPKHVLQNHVEECVSSLSTIIDDEENLQYLITHISNRRFLDNLSRAKIDVPKLKGIMVDTNNPTTLKTLASMLPKDDGYCGTIKYASSGTSTGRLTVMGGPHILTVPVAARRCLVSDYDGGEVLQIDIVSAEPKFALHVKGDKPPHDVYAHIATTILRGEVERHHAKLITLCALYGQSPKKLAKKLPPGIDVNKVISQTKEYFGASELIRRLRQQRDIGELRNALGRPLFVDSSGDHLLISHFLQSSVAESAILMFQQFLSDMKADCKPLFVVHDALLIDTSASVAKELLAKENVQLRLGNWDFAATIKLVKDS